MTSHLLYEGTTLERVLERVQQDHGEAARIVAADRVRRGGVGGFFAKELFQLTVEVDDAEAPGTDAGAACADDRRGAAHGEVPSEADGDPGAGRSRAGRSLGRIAPRRRLVGAGAVTEIVPQGASGRRGEAFAASLADALAAPPPVATVEEVRPAIVSGLRRHDPPIPTGSPAPQAVADPSWAQINLGGLSSPSSVSLDLTAPVGATVVQLRPHRVRRASTSPAQLGALLAELDRDWCDPPRLPGSGVVALVGPPDDVRRAAVATAARAGVDVADVVVASPNDPSDPPTAAQLEAVSVALRGRHRAGPPIVVVVEARPGRPGHDWARVVLSGLGADQVRYVASADRRADAHVMAIMALGGVGSFDAVDVVDAGLADAPEELLGLGVPVATLDGRDATAVGWAALVLAARDRTLAEGEGAEVIDQFAGSAR